MLAPHDRVAVQPSVAVIEDDPAITRLLTDLLEDEDYTVQVFGSGVGVLDALRRRPPRAVLLDLGLPYRSGVRVLRDLKADPRTTSIPVIIVSANTHLLSAHHAALATAVFPKPFDRAALLATLHTVG